MICTCNFYFFKILRNRSKKYCILFPPSTVCIKMFPVAAGSPTNPSVKSCSTSALWSSADAHWEDSPHPGSLPSSSLKPGPPTSPDEPTYRMLLCFNFTHASELNSLHFFLKKQMNLVTWVSACSVVSVGFSRCKASSVVWRAFSLCCNTKEDCCCWRTFSRSLWEEHAEVQFKTVLFRFQIIYLLDYMFQIHKCNVLNCSEQQCPLVALLASNWTQQSVHTTVLWIIILDKIEQKLLMSDKENFWHFPGICPEKECCTAHHLELWSRSSADDLTRLKEIL